MLYDLWLAIFCLVFFFFCCLPDFNSAFQRFQRWKKEKVIYLYLHENALLQNQDTMHNIFHLYPCLFRRWFPSLNRYELAETTARPQNIPLGK